MPGPRKVFLDLDGVCANFIAGALAAHNRPRADHDKVHLWEVWTVLGMTEAQFWAPLTSANFWASLDPYPDMAGVVAACEGFAGRLNVCLLTTPYPSPGCLAGKFTWVRSHLPDCLRRYVMAPDKTFCAAEGAVLVDDCDANVRAWKDAGGLAVLYPRPWNARRALAGDSLAVLRDDLRRLASLSVYPD